MFVEEAVPQDVKGAAVREVDPADLPTERLEHEITAIAAQINAGCCRWLELIAEFDRREAWESWGCRSCAEWVAWQCSLNTRAAREHVRVARRLQELPKIHGQFASGRLSYSNVRALTRVAEPESEVDLLELARQATASQLERIVRGLRRVTTREADERQQNRYLVTWWETTARSPSTPSFLPRTAPSSCGRSMPRMTDFARDTSTVVIGARIGAVPRNRPSDAVPRNRERRRSSTNAPSATPTRTRWSSSPPPRPALAGAPSATRLSSMSTLTCSPTMLAGRCGSTTAPHSPRRPRGGSPAMPR